MKIGFIITVYDGFLIKVPNDIKKPIISNWSDGTTTFEFYSSIYEMEYDSFEFNVDKQMKEITLPTQGDFKIIKQIPKRYQTNIDKDKWFFIKKINKPETNIQNWKEIKFTKIKTYQLGDEPELIHVIKIRDDEYMVVHHDGYDLKTGATEILFKKDIETKFNVVF